MAELRILLRSDAFEAEWARLADANGLTLVMLTEPAQLVPRMETLTMIAAGGEEGALELALREMPAGNRRLVAIGADTSHRLAASVVRAGAEDYFALPGDMGALREWVREGAAALRAAVDAGKFAEQERSAVQFDGILGNSASLRAALARAARVIPHGTVTVLITGETGTGKELLARAIHYNGPRRAAPFVDVNCAAIPENLLESELFGHEKGAFTGATGMKPGLIQLADGGTLFLDEIGHLALPLQGKLLRALEERAVRRVGGTRALPFDVRLIAATHVGLADAVKRGEFREDLYYRLNVVPVELPPLRSRNDDIVLIARHFLDRFRREYDVPEATFSPQAIRALTERAWPGNVRELRNTVERAVLLANGPIIDASDVSDPAMAAALDASGLPFPSTIGELSRAAARLMLSLTGGNKTEAARRLGISRPRLHRLLNASTDDDGDEDIAGLDS
ncbi:MAG TPA: sigma-54 dependent transcriptional regulator [Gemmatimonadaceae bacterium]|nr:sigma-54 dependent transcriptional regulator [Gemmatimonadaceae bacterium]